MAKTEENKLEILVGQNATESQKMQIKMDQELASGKLKLSDAHLAVARAALIEQAASEQVLKLQVSQKEVTKFIAASTQARDEASATLAVEYAMYGKTADARAIAMIALDAEKWKEAELIKLREEKKPITDQVIAQLNAEKSARILVGQATVGQTDALRYAAKLAEENAQFGIDYILDDQARAAASLARDVKTWQERIRLAGEGTDAQKKLQGEYGTWYQNQLLKPQLDADKAMWGSIESTAHDTFISIFNSGKSAFNRLRDTLKNGLLDLLYQMTIKKWIFNIGTSISSIGGAGQISGGSDMASMFSNGASLFSAGKMIYSGFQTGLVSSMGNAISSMGSMFGSQAVSAFGTGMTMTPAAAQSMALSFGGQGAVASTGASAAGASAGAYAIPIAGWIAAGMMLSKSLYGQGWDANNGTMSPLVTTGIGSGIMGLNKILKGVGLSDSAANIFSGQATLSRLFGRKNPEIERQGIDGTFSASGFSGQNYADIVEKGGLFRSDKRYTKTSNIDVGFDASLDDTVKNMMLAVKGFGAQLGVEASKVDSYSKAIKLELTSDDAKNQELLTGIFSGIGDDLAILLVPTIAQFKKTGETVSITLQRLAGDFQATDQMAQLIGKSAKEVFGSVGIDSATARERLIDMAGGMSVLGQQAAFFSQNFLTDAERIAPVSKALSDAMASLGLSAVATREQFKAVIDGLDLTTDAGAAEYTSLMRLAEAFAQVHPAIVSTADALRATATGLLSGVDDSFSVLQRVVDREKASINARIDAETAAIGKLKSLSDSLHSTLDGMKIAGTETADRASAQAQIKTALAIAKAGGPLPNADALKKSLGIVSQDASAMFSTYQDYQRDFYSTQNDIASLADLTDNSLSVEEKSLKAMQEEIKRLDDIVLNAQTQIDVLKGIDTTAISILQAIAGLNLSIANATANPIVGSTAGINTAYQTALGRAPDKAGLEYWQNIAGGGTSIDDITKLINGSPEAQIKALYGSTLGRPADVGGLNYWMNALSNGASTDAIRQAMMGGTEYKDHHSIPGFANGGDFAGGLRLVGEIGPEVEATGASRIHSTRDLMANLRSPDSNNAAIVEELKALRAEVVALRKANSNENYYIAKNTLNTSDMFERATLGGGPMMVTIET